MKSIELYVALEKMKFMAAVELEDEKRFVFMISLMYYFLILQERRVGKK